MTMRVFVGALLVLAFAGCGPNADARYDAGYSDGYAAGYNTTCQIRSTLVEGDWDDKNYASGYRDGYASGAQDCKRKQDE